MCGFVHISAVLTKTRRGSWIPQSHLKWVMGTELIRAWKITTPVVNKWRSKSMADLRKKQASLLSFVTLGQGWVLSSVCLRRALMYSRLASNLACGCGWPEVLILLPQHSIFLLYAEHITPSVLNDRRTTDWSLILRWGQQGAHTGS